MGHLEQISSRRAHTSRVIPPLHIILRPALTMAQIMPTMAHSERSFPSRTSTARHSRSLVRLRIICRGQGRRGLSSFFKRTVMFQVALTTKELHQKRIAIVRMMDLRVWISAFLAGLSRNIPPFHVILRAAASLVMLFLFWSWPVSYPPYFHVFAMTLQAIPSSAPMWLSALAKRRSHDLIVPR